MLPDFGWDRVHFLPSSFCVLDLAQKNVDNTLMFSVVAVKSRAFFSFSCSADEQVGRSWEGAEPGSQPTLASGNTPYHKRHAQ